MPHLVVRRKQDSFGVLRAVKIEIDGHVVARLRPGGEASVPVSDGHHAIRATFDWQSSPVLDIEVCGEDVLLETSLPWRALRAAFTRRGVELDRVGQND